MGRKQSEGWAEWEKREGAWNDGLEYIRECEGRSEKSEGRGWGTRESRSEKSGGSLSNCEDESFGEVPRKRFRVSPNRALQSL